MKGSEVRRLNARSNQAGVLLCQTKTKSTGCAACCMTSQRNGPALKLANRSTHRKPTRSVWRKECTIWQPMVYVILEAYADHRPRRLQAARAAEQKRASAETDSAVETVRDSGLHAQDR